MGLRGGSAPQRFDELSDRRANRIDAGHALLRFCAQQFECQRSWVGAGTGQGVEELEPKTKQPPGASLDRGGVSIVVRFDPIEKHQHVLRGVDPFIACQSEAFRIVIVGALRSSSGDGGRRASVDGGLELADVASRLRDRESHRVVGWSALELRQPRPRSLELFAKTGAFDIGETSHDGASRTLLQVEGIHDPCHTVGRMARRSAFHFTARLCVLGLAASACKSVSKQPGQKAFDAATVLISSKDGTVAHGNTNACQERAELLSEVLQRMARVGFSQTDELGGSIGSNEPFVVHCEHSIHGLAFLVQVPRLEQYQDEVRSTLARLAWKSSELVTQDLVSAGSNGSLELGVGLHGKAFYGVVLTGKHGTDPAASLEDVAKATPLFVFFDSPDAAETPIPPELVETTRAIVSASETKN